MSTPFESAQLNLQLFDLRREAVLREARAWFLKEFNPESLDELLQITRGEHNAWFRMVIGYWEMAASMVTTGAIDREAFLAAHGEILATFSKVYPFLSGLREAVGEPKALQHIEAVVMAEPNAGATFTRLRTGLIAMAKAQKEEAAKTKN